MGNLDLYNRVRIVPEEAKKPIKGGRLNGMTDINPMWRIKVLTSEYGPVSYTHLVRDRGSRRISVKQ